MLQSIKDWFLGQKESFEGLRVLEAGSRDVNGSLRDLSIDAKEYIGIDIQEGPGVDMVLDAREMIQKFGPVSFDVVICTETLEHVQDWRRVVESMKNILKVDGFIYLTAPAPGFPKHNYPGDFWRFTCRDFLNMFADFAVCDCRFLEVSMYKGHKTQNQTACLDGINVTPVA
jgi:SAM-dependent methyltransferase